MVRGGVAAVYFLSIQSKRFVALMNEIVASMMILFSTKFRFLFPNRSKLQSVSEFSLLMSISRRKRSLAKEISTHQVKLVVVQEKVLVIFNNFPTHTSWATTVKVVSKSVLIQCAEVHTQLCQLFYTFYIKDIINSVFRWSYNCK